MLKNELQRKGIVRKAVDKYYQSFCIVLYQAYRMRQSALWKRQSEPHLKLFHLYAKRGRRYLTLRSTICCVKPMSIKLRRIETVQRKKDKNAGKRKVTECVALEQHECIVSQRQNKEVVDGGFKLPVDYAGKPVPDTHQVKNRRRTKTPRKHLGKRLTSFKARRAAKGNNDYYQNFPF